MGQGKDDIIIAHLGKRNYMNYKITSLWDSSLFRVLKSPKSIIPSVKNKPSSSVIILLSLQWLIFRYEKNETPFKDTFEYSNTLKFAPILLQMTWNLASVTDFVNT